MRIEHGPQTRRVPYAANARIHSDDQVAHIAASILAFDFNSPLLVDPLNEVIDGHARLLAARRLDLDRAYCTVVVGWEQYALQRPSEATDFDGSSAGEVRL